MGRSAEASIAGDVAGGANVSQGEAWRGGCVLRVRLGGGGVDVDEALTLWDGFPVGRGARPIVLMDAAIGPGRGLWVGWRGRVLRGRQVVSEVELPTGILERLQPATAPAGD